VKIGISKDTCEFVNRWMDEPAKRYPGCTHRKYRHSDFDCLTLGIAEGIKEARRTGSILKGVKKMSEVIKACKLHIELDKKEGKCKF